MAANKKFAVAAVSSLLLVAMVVALMYNGRNSGDDGGDSSVGVTASQKAMVTINTLCSNTDYKTACVDTLKNSGNDTSDPKELMEISFQATMNHIAAAAKNSSVLREVQKDPRGKEALDACTELAETAVADLNRTFEKFKKEFSEFDLTDANNILGDLKIWLSGAITNQETCLDGFEGVDGDAGDQMKNYLNISMQMSSNALAMLNGMQSILNSFTAGEISSLTAQGRRRLLSAEGDPAVVVGHEDEIIPDWVDAQRRKLLSEKHKPKLHKHIKPDLVVAKDGSGDFKTINEALYKVPEKSEKTFVLYIREGIYEEQVKINSSFTHLLIIGDGPKKTRITGKLNFINGTTTYLSATVAVHGDHFTAMDIGFENTAGPEGHQAVALRVSADLAIFYNCHMDGYQDTLYAHTYRQYYRDCTISGTIDYIFGDSAAIFQGCTMVVRKPLENQYCIVTAQGRKDVHQPTGLVLQNCTIIGDPDYYPVSNVNKAYLARPWKLYSRAVIMESYIDKIIQPDGYLPWNGTFALDTLFYTEFNNRGPGADKTHRLKWPGIKELPGKRMKRFTADDFVDGSHWAKHNKMKIPYEGGFIFDVPKDDPNVDYSPVGSEETKDDGKMRDRDQFVAPKGPENGDKKKDDSKESDHADDKKKKDDDKKQKKDDSKDSDHDDGKKKKKGEKKKKGKSSGDVGTLSVSSISSAPVPAPASVSPSPSPSVAPAPGTGSESELSMFSFKKLFFRE